MLRSRAQPTKPAEVVLHNENAVRIFEECLAIFLRVRLIVTGSCMGEALPEGSGVTVEHRSVRRPRIGDIVLVRQPEGLRLHRLIWGPPVALCRQWRTKADRSRRWDARVAEDAVLGTVVGSDRGIEPGGRRVRRAAWSFVVAVASRAWGALPARRH
jgi:hypothetical protein